MGDRPHPSSPNFEPVTPEMRELITCQREAASMYEQARLLYEKGYPDIAARAQKLAAEWSAMDRSTYLELVPLKPYYEE